MKKNMSIKFPVQSADELRSIHAEYLIQLASRVMQGQEVVNEFRQTINLTEFLNSLNAERQSVQTHNNELVKHRKEELVDIIIPVYKNAYLTKRCIDSVLTNLREIREFSPRIIIINDSPDDDEVNSLLKES